MPQKYVKVKDYKGVEVRRPAQLLPQKYPNGPQTETPQRCYSSGKPTLSSITGGDFLDAGADLAASVGNVLGGLVVGIVEGVREGMEIGQERRAKRKAWSALSKLRKEEDIRVALCNETRRRQSPPCRHSGSPVINVYGDNNTVNINNG